MAASEDTVSAHTNNVTALTAEQERKKNENIRRLTDNASGLNLITFLLALFFDKDSELLKNDDAVESLASAFSVETTTFKETITRFQNNEISSFTAAQQVRESIPDTSSVNWQAAEDTVTKYAPMGNPLLELIADKESGGDYNRIYGAGHQTRPLTEMTINEVIAWQKEFTDNGSPSSAAGKYQIIRKTLMGLKDEMGLTGDEKYDEAMQDRMATSLLNGRGYQDYLSGDIDESTFMENISKEWAAMPKDMNGKSYYDNDGLNKALVTPETLLLAIRNTKEINTEQQTLLASSFNDAKNALSPLDTDSGQPAPLSASFDGNGVNEIDKNTPLTLAQVEHKNTVPAPAT